MMTLTLIRHPSNADGGYRSTLEGEWMPGETREIEDDRGAELLTDWPDAFTAEPVKGEQADEEPFDAYELLDGPVRYVLPRLRALESPSALGACLAAELDGKARRTILDHLTERLGG